tara:strand:+ start:585 stop:755 length:171 start_codon:yes stop_codon:yes gene_type:complete
VSITCWAKLVVLTNEQQQINQLRKWLLIKVAEVFFGKASNMVRYSYNDEKHKERSL